MMDLDELERLLREATAEKTGDEPSTPVLLDEADLSFLDAILHSAEALIRDARRYRWLRTIARQARELDVHGKGAHWTTGFHTEDGRLDFAAALDAAIAQEGKG